MNTTLCEEIPTIIDRQKIHLSPREKEILTLVGCCTPTKTIASKLRISPKTVETHRSRIISRVKGSLGNGNRVATLTHLAIALGLVQLNFRDVGKIEPS